ncbi:MAG: DUF2177 family protein [Acidobacteria bacterium]|nr:DUF2177 family protein [Acidobacteriota bacterium]
MFRASHLRARRAEALRGRTGNLPDATLTQYTLRMTVVDMCWGFVLSALTAAAMAAVSSPVAR